MMHIQARNTWKRLLEEVYPATSCGLSNQITLAGQLESWLQSVVETFQNYIIKRNSSVEWLTLKLDRYL